MSDKPYKLPPPSSSPIWLPLQAWMEDVDDNSRLILEMNADTIRKMHKQQFRLAQAIERLELRLERIEAAR
jgi:hypothetical protein